MKSAGQYHSFVDFFDFLDFFLVLSSDESPFFRAFLSCFEPSFSFFFFGFAVVSRFRPAHGWTPSALVL